MKIITFGGATRDIFIHYEQGQTVAWSSKQEIKSFLLLQEGAKIEISSIEYLTGGGAGNSATSFKRLGFDVSIIVKVGNDEQGIAILAELQNEGIGIDTCLTSPISTGISYIIPAADGDNTVLAFRGANAHISPEEFPFGTLEHGTCLYITSLSGQSSQLLLPVSRYAKKQGIVVANNPGISQLSSGIDVLRTSLPFIDIFILNSNEAQQFMSSLAQKDSLTVQESSPLLNTREHKNIPHLLATPWQCKNICFSLIQFFKTIEHHGPKIVVVTDGARGVYVYANNTIYYHPSLPVSLINTLGAGDAFGSCFVASLMRKNSIEQAMMHGLLNSSSVISHMGAKTGLLTQEELEKRAKKINLSLMQKFSI